MIPFLFPPQTAMELMGLVGVMVNCALIGLSGQVDRMFPNITTNQTILLIILLEVRSSNYDTPRGKSAARIRALGSLL